MNDTQIQTEPTITRRALITHTIKDGWRVSEISVTVAGETLGVNELFLGRLLAQTHAEAEAGIAEILGQPF